MNDKRAIEEALFRHSVLGPLLHKRPRRGELRRTLEALAQETYEGPQGEPREVKWKTLEEWYYRYRHEGFDGLRPRPRKDRGTIRAVSPQLVALICEMKREDPGRTVPLMIRELELAGRIGKQEVSDTTVRRILDRAGLSGPKMELKRPTRLRFVAAHCGALWQGDALHGPKLLDPQTSRERRAIIFGVLDDRSRLVPYLRADFQETEQAFLGVLHGAIARRGIPLSLYLDNHKSFCGHDLRVLCAKLRIRLLHTPSYDGPSKGKIERFWRTLRLHVLNRLNPQQVTTLDELNLRLWSWVEGEYHHRPHAGLDGRTPLHVFEQDAEAIRWVEDHSILEQLFVGEESRLARNDSTIQFRGKSYEVPCHLRGQKVAIRYSLLHPERLSVLDADVEVPLRIVQPEKNAVIRRTKPLARPTQSANTGLNAVELVLDRVCGRDPGKNGGDPNA
jgi:putative transposase